MLGKALALAIVAILATPVLAQETPSPQAPPAADGPYELLVRTDDIGFCHGTNAAIEKILDEGIVTCVSVMVVTPWLDETVKILEKHPDVSVGVHLTLNSEWDEYRWGPVLPASEVPSLVDKFGKFHPSRAIMMAGRPKVEEVEKELRAQIELALAKGLKISYVDYHMGAAMNTREFQEKVELLAGEFNLGISRYYGEQDLSSLYRVEPADKVDFAVKTIEAIDKPGRYMFVIHPGTDDPEMKAMTDRNATGLPNMSEHRAAEAALLCDPRFAEAVKKKGMKLVGYRDLRMGNFEMKRSFEAKPYDEVVKDAEATSPYKMFEASKPAAP